MVNGEKLLAQIQLEAQGKPAERRMAASNEMAGGRREARQKTWDRLMNVFSAGADVVRGINPIPGAVRASANVLHRGALGIYGLRMGARNVDQFLGNAVDKGLRTLEARGNEKEAGRQRFKADELQDKLASFVQVIEQQYKAQFDGDDGTFSLEDGVDDDGAFDKIKGRLEAEVQEIKAKYEDIKVQVDKLDAMAQDLRGQSKDYVKNAVVVSKARSGFARLFGLRQGSKGYNVLGTRAKMLWKSTYTGLSSVAAGVRGAVESWRNPTFEEPSEEDGQDLT